MRLRTTVSRWSSELSVRSFSASASVLGRPRTLEELPRKVEVEVAAMGRFVARQLRSADRLQVREPRPAEKGARYLSTGGLDVWVSQCGSSTTLIRLQRDTFAQVGLGAALGAARDETK